MRAARHLPGALSSALLLVMTVVVAMLTSPAISAAPRCFGAEARNPDHPCDPGRLRFTSTPTPYAAALEPGAYCRPLLASPRTCTFGGPPRTTAGVALVGDSHGAHWRAALSVVAERRRWRGYSITRNSCPFELARTTGKGRCSGYVDGVLAFLRKHPSIHTVVASQNRSSGVSIPPGQSYVTAKVNGFLRAWAALPSSVDRVVVLRDVPRAGLGTQACVARRIAQHRDPGIGCARPRRAALGVDLESAAANRSSEDRAVAVDLTPYMCGPTRCLAVVGGALVIRDIGHMTTTFSRSLGPALGRAIHDAEGQVP